MQRVTAAARQHPAAADGGLSIPPHLQRFLVRQPILDGHYHLAGYELALRERVPVPALPGAQCLQQMRDEMLLTSVIDMAYQQALGDRLTFLAVTTDTLMNPMLAELSSDRIVLSVDGAAPIPAAEPLQAAFAQGGITLALDDPPLRSEIAPLLRHCRYVRLDVTRHDVPNLIEQVRALRSSSKARLIARNVDTEEAFEACRKLQFDLFQGYYFTCLQPSFRNRIDSSRQRIMDLLNLVMTQAEASQIEARFKTDAGLTYKLLRLINSPAFGLRGPVRSIGQALMLLGHDQLYRWLTLLLFTQGPADPRGKALLRHALIRARFAETLGETRLPARERGGLFLVGILSTLDALFNVPMAQALSQLRLPDEIVAALTRREGLYAPYLQLVLACEQFDQERIAQLAEMLGASPDEVNLAHVKAMIWAEGLDA